LCRSVYVRGIVSAGYLKFFSLDRSKTWFPEWRAIVDRTSRALADPHKAAELIRQASVWRFEALVAGLFFVLLIVLGSAMQWWQLIRRTKRAELHESEFVPVGNTQRMSEERSSYRPLRIRGMAHCC
jgi:hypothetical protein